MPNRIIKESSRTSPNLAALSDPGERLWHRVVTAVDDFGRLEADPELVLAICFPRKPKGWTAGRVAGALLEMARRPSPTDEALILLYEVNGRPYLQICKADAHIHKRASKSKFPDPPINQHDSNCTQPLAIASLNGNGNGNVIRERVTEETPTLTLTKRKRPLTEWPDGFRYTEHHQIIADGLGLKVQEEFVKFKDKAQAKAWTYADWHAAFRNWMNNAVAFKEAKR